MRRLDTNVESFEFVLESLLNRSTSYDSSVIDVVNQIIEDVRTRGDSAVVEHTAQFDEFEVNDINSLEVPSSKRKQAFKNLPSRFRVPLEAAARRIRVFHEHQTESSWQYDDGLGNILGQIITPLERVGIYVPGGKAAYPSSVLMSAVPARIAGVSEIIMMVPTPSGEINDTVMAASHLAGVDRVFRIGGAQAIAALAIGTLSIPRVDKIVGPGNAYVATAKKVLFGEVGIDMVAGPSEVVIIADSGANPNWLVKDLFAQAEHDENAQSILLSPDSKLIEEVEKSIKQALPQMDRRSIIESSLHQHGALVKVRSLEEAVLLSNKIAPEHLQLMVEDPDCLLKQVNHAGAIFCGYWSAEVLGDYCAGPNHVLPTSGTARFSSPLGVYDFQKKTSLIQCSQSGAGELSEIATILAEHEGLFAHASSARYRGRKK